MIASGNGRFAKRNLPFRETFAVSFAGHFFYTFHDIKGDAYNSLFPGQGPRPMLESCFLSLLLSRNYRGSFAKCCGFPENGYLDDMCYVKAFAKP